MDLLTRVILDGPDQKRRDAESCIRSQKTFAGNFRVAPKDNSLHPVDEFVITELELP
jgi:hypothetical protein